MSRSIYFSKIDVRRMPGFPKGGLIVDGFVEGINVVYGPNAAGKTTLARAMQLLMRPHDEGHQTDSIEAKLVVAGTPYELDYHLGQVTCRTAGNIAPLPTLAPAEVGQQYVLALHDLIDHEDDRDIVKQILQEAAGGYDLAAAATDLGFNRDRPSGRNTNVVRSYDQSVVDRRKAEARLVEIDRDAMLQKVLQQQCQQAQQAQVRQRLIEHAISAMDKKSQLEQAQAAVEAFPESMSKYRGDECQRLIDLEANITEQQDKLTTTTASRATAGKEIEDSGLPEAGVATELVGTNQNRCDSLRSKAAEIRRFETELAEAQASQQEKLESLGPDILAEQAVALDTSTVNELFKFVRRAEEQQHDKQAADQTISWLDAIPESDQNPDALRDGIQLLYQWLATQSITPARASSKREWLVAAGITATVSAGMAFVVDTSWLLILGLAAGFVGWAFFRPRTPTTSRAIQEIPAQLEGLGLNGPTAWTPAEVQAAQRKLQQDLATVQLYQEKTVRLAAFQERRDNHQEKQAAIEADRQRWRDQLGIQIDLDDVRLYLLAAALHEVQVAQARVTAAQEKLATAQQQDADLLTKINDEIASFVDGPAVDADQASALVRELDQRRQKYEAAVGQRNRDEIAIGECNGKIQKLEADRKKLFNDLGLKADDELTLQQWDKDFEQFQQAVEDQRMAKRELATASIALADHEELLEQTREQLQTEFDECGRVAEELTALNEKLGDILGRIQRAKEETALEKALAGEETCLDELRAGRDNDAAQMVGTVLVSYLAKQQRDDQQPGVLTRAGKLFSCITQGRYKLTTEPGDPPRFQAIDTSLGIEQNLNQLSSGTRLQLLLSVRVAFVEQQEQGLKLPLIFDETLGNSDEQRARRIIESAVEIARGGRQVFYFTAQHDELGKWRRVLAETDGVLHCEFDLAALRNFSEVEHAPKLLDFEPPPSIPVPAPEDDDWMAYGLRLNVPPPDPRGHLGGLHLLFVVDDVDELYRLLSHNINKWGQLQTLVDIGSAEGLDRQSPLFLRAAANARLLENLFRCWRQGRGEKVDRNVLVDSDAVTKGFIDEVDQLCQSHDGDAVGLIEDLRAGSVARFRVAQIDALESYLVESGCLDDQPILDAASIREKVTPSVFADCETGLLSTERVDQLIALVTSADD